MARGQLASIGKRSNANLELKKGRRHLQKHKDAYARRNDSLGVPQNAMPLGAVHPSYFKNERYQKLYKNVLDGLDEGELGQSNQGLIPRRQPKTDAAGVPLSNQILYEKLDFDSDDKETAAGNA